MTERMDREKATFASTRQTAYEVSMLVTIFLAVGGVTGDLVPFATLPSVLIAAGLIFVAHVIFSKIFRLPLAFWKSYVEMSVEQRLETAYQVSMAAACVGSLLLVRALFPNTYGDWVSVGVVMAIVAIAHFGFSLVFRQPLGSWKPSEAAQRFKAWWRGRP